MSSIHATGARINGSTCEPLFWLSGLQLACPSAAPPQHGRMGRVKRLVPRPVQSGSGGQLNSSNKLLVQKAPATSLGFWRTIAAPTQGVFRKRYLLHELVFAGSQPPPRQPRNSFTILSAMRNWSPSSCTDNGSECARSCEVGGGSTRFE